MKRIQRLLRSSRLARVALRAAVSVFGPRNMVGVVGVILDDEGRVLVAEHVFRSRYHWGLPGGWVGRGEDPAEALRRELREELGLSVTVGQVLLCRRESTSPRMFSPRNIGVAFLCRAEGEDPQVRSRELLGVRWVDPNQERFEWMPFQRDAIEIALQFQLSRVTS